MAWFAVHVSAAVLSSADIVSPHLTVLIPSFLPLFPPSFSSSLLLLCRHRGQRIESRFSRNPIRMTGRVVSTLRGEVQGSSRFLMVLNRS